MTHAPWRGALLVAALPACVLIDYDSVKRDAGAPLPEAAPPAARDGGPTDDASDPSMNVSTPAPAPTCAANEWCSYRCGGTLGPCALTCSAGQLCEVRCDGEGACQGIVCEQGATCALHCDGTAAGRSCLAACKSPSAACTGAGVSSWCGTCVALPVATQ
jgi:hypothetical protein